MKVWTGPIAGFSPTSVEIPLFFTVLGDDTDWDVEEVSKTAY